MAGHQPFARLRGKLHAGSRAGIAARKAELRAEMLLHELGQARAMTRKAVGEALDLGQPAVARLEQRADMHVSGLRSCIEATGGRLDIVARFPKGNVVVKSLSDAGEDRIEAAQDPEAGGSKLRRRLPLAGTRPRPWERRQTGRLKAETSHTRPTRPVRRAPGFRRRLGPGLAWKPPVGRIGRCRSVGTGPWRRTRVRFGP